MRVNLQFPTDLFRFSEEIHSCAACPFRVEQQEGILSKDACAGNNMFKASH